MERLKKMNKKEVTFRDPVVERVVDKFVSRSDEGFKKYGATLNDERRSGVKDLDKYLNDVMEELMDAVLYIQTAREEIAEKKLSYTYPEFKKKFYNEKKI
jgi:predicted MPP superfamily phosphohydrolase